MIPLLADISFADASILGVVVIVLVFLSGWFFDYRRDQREAAGQFEPRATPALHRQFVTREEFEKLEQRVDDLRVELLEKLDDNNEEGEKRVVKLHERIDALPSRIITLLRETKGLL